MHIRAFIESAVLLFVLLNPFLLCIYLLDLIQELNVRRFGRVLMRASVISGVVFVAFAWAGDAIFSRVLQVRFCAFQIFGCGTSKTIQLVENAFAIDFLDGSKTFCYFSGNPNIGVRDNTNEGRHGATSEHTGGLFGVTMADGASKFLSYNIDEATYQALLTRNNGDQPGEY